MYRALRIILSLLIVVGLGACTTVVQGGVSQTYTPVGQFVKVLVVNYCSQDLDIMRPEGKVATVKYGNSFTVVLERRMFTSQYGALTLLLQARDGEVILGSATRTYNLNAWNSGQEETWTVNYLDSKPNRSPGCTA